MYSINFEEHNKKFCWWLHYDGVNSYLVAMVQKLLKFKAKDSEIVATPLCLGNISKYFSADNMKKTGLYGYVYSFNVDYDTIAIDNILDIQKYLMKKHDIKYCFGLLKKYLL